MSQQALNNILRKERKRIKKLMQRAFDDNIKKYPDSRRVTEYMALVFKRLRV